MIQSFKDKGQHFIRINDQWRLCFTWEDNNAHNVEIIDTALRLSKYFGNSVEFWVGIQADYEIRKTRKSLEKQLAKINQLESIYLY